jgi:hypothetical protein
MTRITIDGPVVQQLGQAVEPVEIFDARGRLLGNFTPHIPKALRPEDRCPYTEEELNLRRQGLGKGGKKAAQILKDLGYEP